MNGNYSLWLYENIVERWEANYKNIAIALIQVQLYTNELWVFK
ncbi:MAG: hypothetical protein ACFCUV_12815 [Rivularia sp. (in: cyanobacteria)]